MPLRPPTIKPVTITFKIRGYYHGYHMPPAQACNQIVIHHLPINGTLNCPEYRQYWTISQLLRTRGTLHPIITNLCDNSNNDGKRLAVKLATEIAKVFHDENVEWQDSFQLPYLSAVMREFNPNLWGRWGERWTYTEEYMNRVLRPMNCPWSPTYTIADRYQEDDTFWNAWGKFKGQWGTAVLGLEETPDNGVVKRYRRIG